MLPEIAAEALHFLSRRDLDKACAVSKWLDSLIAQCFEVYPLRPVLGVALFPHGDSFSLHLSSMERVWADCHSFNNIDEAALFAASVLRHSKVELLELFGHCLDNMALYPDQWTTIVDATRNGAVRRLYFGYVDFSAFDNDAFQAVVRCSGLRSLLIRQSDVPSGLVLDSLIRSGAAMGLLQLRFTAAISDAPRSLSDDAVLDFFFRADTAPRPHEDFLYLEVTGSSVTDSFLTKFFERLQSGPARPNGSLTLFGAVKQRGVAAYSQYSTAGGIYRFPSTDDDTESYNVSLSDRIANSGYTRMDIMFGPVCRRLS